MSINITPEEENLVDKVLEIMLDKILHWEKMYKEGDCAIDTLFFDTRSLRNPISLNELTIEAKKLAIEQKERCLHSNHKCLKGECLDCGSVFDRNPKYPEAKKETEEAMENFRKFVRHDDKCKVPHYFVNHETGNFDDFFNEIIVKAKKTERQKIIATIRKSGIVRQCDAENLIDKINHIF